MTDDNAITPIEVGGELMNPNDAEAMRELLGGTTGQSSSPLEQLAIFNQGKEDYFSFGDDEKCESVLGIFLYSARPMRAFWPLDSQMDGSAPTCFSVDGQTPSELVHNPESPSCADCVYDKLGTAKVGKGKACKTKAADFIIQVPDSIEIVDGIAQIDPSRILGPGLLRYSIANREGPAEFVRYLKSAKEIGSVPFPQAVLGKWSFQRTQSKSGVKFFAIKMEAVAALPSPQDDPALWAVIMKETKALKQGQANEILAILSGGAVSDEE